jgi:hypothetical protein
MYTENTELCVLLSGIMLKVIRPYVIMLIVILLSVLSSKLFINEEQYPNDLTKIYKKCDHHLNKEFQGPVL